MKPVLLLFGILIICINSARGNSSINGLKSIGYYGINLGVEKTTFVRDLRKLSVHYLDRAEHTKILGQGKLASVIFQFKDICAQDSKELGKGYELIICTLTSEEAKRNKIKGMALVFANSKLFRIEVKLEEKSTKELVQLLKDADSREKDTLNAIGKSNLLISFFPFLYSEKRDPLSQRIFQKGQAVFAVVTESSATYVVLLEPTILFEHQNKK